jgi:hypothetical protein
VRYTLTLSSHWFFASIAGFLAALPWVSRRFSLRTMLVVTTLISMFLAAVAASL